MPEELRPDLSGVMVEEYPQMVAALLLPDVQLRSLSPAVFNALDKFVASGKPVIASGQYARLPEGMTASEAKAIMVQTVKEYRG